MANRISPILYLSIFAIGLLALGGCALFESKEVSQGRKLYSFYCAHCHGEKGNGKGHNAEHLDPHPRDLTDSVEPYMADAGNEDIFIAIKNGLSGVVWKDGVIKPGNQLDEDYAFGSTLMPYWGFTLTDDEIWALVAYVRTLHRNDAEKVRIEQGKDEGRKAITRPVVNVDFNKIQGREREKLIEDGHYLYQEKYACPACHQVNGDGGEVGPDLSRAGFRFNPDWVYGWIKSASSIKRHTKMPDFGMPDEDALAITVYLGSLK